MAADGGRRGAAVEARGLARRFGAQLALDGVDLRVEPGEAFGLLGANGAGKTTFLRLVTGYLLPSAGRVLVDGVSPSRDARAVTRRLGFVAETARLYPELRVRSLLRFVAGARELAPSPVGQVRGRRWIVPVTSVLLLAMLGTGPGTDVIAHALGLVVGAALGLAAAIVRRPVAAPIQRALVAAVALAIAGCWYAALAGRAG